MKIAISGSSGFIGKHLTRFFIDRNETVVSLPHAMFQRASTEQLIRALTGCEVVINLAGASINHRWSAEYKKEIIESRVSTTRQLVLAMNAMACKPALFISVSAIGIYPSRGVYADDSSERGTGFLASVCECWELEAQKITSEIRLVIPRFGVVLASDGGALPKMLLPFRLFLGGWIASGEQGLSWIHINDLMRAFLFVIEHREMEGVVNFVSPQPITNRVFSEAASDVLCRPLWLTIPGFVFWLLYGEGAEVVTSGQHVYPVRLQNSGFKFHYSDIWDTLRKLD